MRRPGNITPLGDKTNFDIFKPEIFYPVVGKMWEHSSVIVSLSFPGMTGREDVQRLWRLTLLNSDTS